MALLPIVAVTVCGSRRVLLAISVVVADRVRETARASNAVPTLAAASVRATGANDLAATAEAEAVKAREHSRPRAPARGEDDATLRAIARAHDPVDPTVAVRIPGTGGRIRSGSIGEALDNAREHTRASSAAAEIEAETRRDGIRPTDGDDPSDPPRVPDATRATVAATVDAAAHVLLTVSATMADAAVLAALVRLAARASVGAVAVDATLTFAGARASATAPLCVADSVSVLPEKYVTRTVTAISLASPE
jgi:hypothetical protein